MFTVSPEASNGARNAAHFEQKVAKEVKKAVEQEETEVTERS
jgi:hypothetical protein